jgi:glycosyltransferase involved in cell wall biosynthesis
MPTVMLGEVHHEQIPRLLANVDIHVTSSLKETFGRTVQESLDVGTPVVAPDCEWTRNLIQSDYNGVLYKAEDGTDFIDKLAALIDNYGVRQQLSQNALSSQYARDDPTNTWLEYLQEKIDLSKTQGL